MGAILRMVTIQNTFEILGSLPSLHRRSRLRSQGRHPAERTTFSFETHVSLRRHPRAKSSSSIVDSLAGC